MTGKNGRTANTTFFHNKLGHPDRALLQQLAQLPTTTPLGTAIKRVQLTYDDGPDSAGNTRKVLDALNAAGARATFYLVGKRVAQNDNWQVVFDMAKTGHWIGNHAYEWNDQANNHIFLHGDADERTEKILLTEWALRSALLSGREESKERKQWDAIPQSNREYIENVITYGTGRFRTPGFRSKSWSTDGNTTMAAIDSTNRILAACGLRPIAITTVTSWFLTHEGVSNDPEDWRAGRTKSEISAKVKDGLDEEHDSILLHSRLEATVDATPIVVADIQRRGWSFAPTVCGAIGSILPDAGFARLKRISNPPTAAEIASARVFFRSTVPLAGSILSSDLALGIFQLAQRVGRGEVESFMAEIRRTSVKTEKGPISLATWMNANSAWRLFYSFYDKWYNNKRFPSPESAAL